MTPRQAPATRPATDASSGFALQHLDRRLVGIPMVEPFAAFRANAYLVALYAPAGDRLELAGWMLHLPWEKNPAPMNRSGSRGGWRTAARQASTVRDVGFQLVQGRIPPQARIRVRLDWHVVTRRTRDEDNLVRCMKHLVDGIRAAGVVVDDDRTYVVRDMPEIHYRSAVDGGYPHMRLYVLIEP